MKHNRVFVKLALNRWALPNGISEAAVKEYMDEFEHQDGYECWIGYFDDMNGIIEDFKLYIEHSD